MSHNETLFQHFTFKITLLKNLTSGKKIDNILKYVNMEIQDAKIKINEDLKFKNILSTILHLAP